MKKITAMILAAVMVFAFATSAFTAGKLTKEDAKMIALEKAGVTEQEATFTKERWDFDDGREEFEFEFFANGVEFDIDVDAVTGRIVKYDTERRCREERDFDDRYDDDFDFDDRDFDDRYDLDDAFDFFD